MKLCEWIITLSSLNARLAGLPNHPSNHPTIHPSIHPSMHPFVPGLAASWPSALKVQNPNHWTAREFPMQGFFKQWIPTH